MLRRPASNGPVHESVQQLLARCAREARSPSPECTDLCSTAQVRAHEAYAAPQPRARGASAAAQKEKKDEVLEGG